MRLCLFNRNRWQTAWPVFREYVRREYSRELFKCFILRIRGLRAAYHISGNERASEPSRQGRRTRDFHLAASL